MKEFWGLFTLMLFVLCSCEEKEEATKYDNWKERNINFCDSIAEKASENYITTLDQIRNVQVGEMFILQDMLSSTNKNDSYIYCKKLISNSEGTRPLWLNTVNVFYHGTLINGEVFDGNFDGYGALDANIDLPLIKVPSEFNSTNKFTISSDSPHLLTTGWCTFLQYMHTGERWIIYVPWTSAYGTNGTKNILGYSMLTFDVVLESIEEDIKQKAEE